MKTAAEIRREFIEFFCRKHDHTHVPGSPVIPHDDPTLLFTNAGMNQFKPIFLGQRTPDVDKWYGATPGSPRRAANSQPCIRAGGKHNDLDDVGHDTYHHTFFEMLGNWSFGDYFKKDAIEWAWELITKVWGIDPTRIHATYFGGDAAEGLEPDLEARDLWCAVPGMSPDRVHPGNKKDNFWEMGDTGPCGPCSEMHIDLTPDRSGGPLVNAGDERVIEFWNLVFIQFNRGPDGKLTPLPEKHVDTGMGFERITRIVQGRRSNYDIDVFTPIFEAIQRAGSSSGALLPPYSGLMESDLDQQGDTGVPPVSRDDVMRNVAYRVIADHIRTLTFAIADGCVPDKDGRGFVLRRILRRAVRYGWQYLGLRKPFLCELVPTVVAVMGEAFPKLREDPKRTTEVLREEEESFGRTLDRGIQLFEEAAARASTLFQNRDRKGAGSSTGPRGDRERAGARAAENIDADYPAAYFITFRTYGTWLHGVDEGSVDDEHNQFGEPLRPAERGLERHEQGELKHPPITLDSAQRDAVARTLLEVASHRGWRLHASHVRTNHVHVVLSAQDTPERVMNDLKSYSTRRLRESGLIGADTHVWSRHGSTRYLWKEQDIEGACNYTAEGQGDELPGSEPITLAEHPEPRGSTSTHSSAATPRAAAPVQNPLPHGRGSEMPVISGADAFKLHDTFGFPIDLTQIMAQERGLRVDIDEYERMMEGARSRARGDATGGDPAVAEARERELQRARAGSPTDDSLKYTREGRTRTTILSLTQVRPADDSDAAHPGASLFFRLRETPFYAEQGGQVADTGTVQTSRGEIEVVAVERVGDSVLHRGIVRRGEVRTGDECEAVVSRDRRAAIERNHTATHLLNLALRETLGPHIEQKGSLVDPDKTRFDFSHPKPLTEEELDLIEARVLDRIDRNLPVDAEVRPQAEARKINTLRAVFGEKYPDEVRVVSIGVPVRDLLANPSNPEWMKHSVEFCGGTHVQRTGQIEQFTLVQEESVSKGIRRLVGITGQAARDAIALAESLVRESAELSRSATGTDLVNAVAQLQKRSDETDMPLTLRRSLREQLAKLQERVKAEEKQRARQSAGDALARLDTLLAAATTHGPTTVVVANLADAGIDALKTLADAIRQKCGSAALFFGAAADGKVSLLAAVTDDLIKRGVKAGDWVKAIAPVVEGGGGGPPTMAQAGGKNPAKLAEALEAAKQWVTAKLG